MDENSEGQEPMQIIGEEEEEDEEDEVVSETSDGEEVEIEQPPRRRSAGSRLGNALIQAFRHPLRITRNIEGRTFSFIRGRPAVRDTEDQEDDEAIPENAEKFDTDLPAEHSYLGSMVRVSGVEYLEAGKTYRILIFMHHSMVFPGETLPMIIPDYMFDSTLFPDEGLLFGVVFPSMWKSTKPDIYGVTCQIYEKGNDESGSIVLKSRAHQRFVISKKNNPNFSEFLKPHQRKIYANIKILPEILLPDPLSSIDMGSLNRFRDIDSMTERLRRLQTATTVWPKFVYDQYNLTSMIERAKKCLFMYKIDSMPTDYALLSFWFGRNLLFDTNERIKIFLTDSVNIRMQIIEKYMDNEKFFCCRICKNKIANCSSLFAMSKHGVQSNYCNPSGFIHETNTIYNVLKDTVYHTGPPSTEFSWFPGYAWQIILCRLCEVHLGWKFTATKPTLVPKKFYGLSGTNIVVGLSREIGESSAGEQQRQMNPHRPEDLLCFTARKLSNAIKQMSAIPPASQQRKQIISGK